MPRHISKRAVLHRSLTKSTPYYFGTRRGTAKGTKDDPINIDDEVEIKIKPVRRAIAAMQLKSFPINKLKSGNRNLPVRGDETEYEADNEKEECLDDSDSESEVEEVVDLYGSYESKRASNSPVYNLTKDKEFCCYGSSDSEESSWMTIKD